MGKSVTSLLSNKRPFSLRNVCRNYCFPSPSIHFRTCIVIIMVNDMRSWHRKKGVLHPFQLQFAFFKHRYTQDVRGVRIPCPLIHFCAVLNEAVKDPRDQTKHLFGPRLPPTSAYTVSVFITLVTALKASAWHLLGKR